MARLRIWSNTAEYLSLSEIERPALAELYQYWRRQGGDEEVPRQKDLSIHEMTQCLANIALLEVTPAKSDDPDLPAEFPIRARYLMVGEALIKLLGVNPTGMLINEVYAKDVAVEVGGALLKAAQTRRALYYRREFQILRKSFGYDRLILPLRLQGVEVRRILLGIYPLDSRLVSADQWRSELDKLADMEGVENRMASAWAESLGYSVTLKPSDAGEASQRPAPSQLPDMDAPAPYDETPDGRSSR